MSSRPTVRLIAAVARNGVMGKGGKLPWSIPEDWSHFLAAVKGGTCISGRRCYEELGQAMPGSDLHIVLSKQKDLHCPDAVLRDSLPEAMKVAHERGGDIWILGGTEVYRQSFELADEFWATHVHADVEGDVYFPDGWQEHFPTEVSRRRSQDEQYSYDFVVYRRDTPADSGVQ
ncbi:Dihydrofolate reductase [Durusdinium trenchii]|uniref:dihydrofolate reductase n=1 Tax=Durusdinium trenchii TaxID=1381693 RepID=A0ABP0M8B3_9DINO